jgi:hypothetical protein
MRDNEPRGAADNGIQIDVFDPVELKRRHLFWLFVFASFGLTLACVSLIGWHLAWESLWLRLPATRQLLLTPAVYLLHAVTIGFVAAASAGIAMPRFTSGWRVAQVVLAICVYLLYAVAIHVPPLHGVSVWGGSLVWLCAWLLVGAAVGESLGRRFISPCWQNVFYSLARCLGRNINRDTLEE